MEAKFTPEKLGTEWVEITDRLYLIYGSETGILFGIPADLRRSVEVIVKTIIRMCIPAPEITAERDRLQEINVKLVELLLLYQTEFEICNRHTTYGEGKMTPTWWIIWDNLNCKARKVLTQ